MHVLTTTTQPGLLIFMESQSDKITVWSFEKAKSQILISKKIELGINSIGKWETCAAGPAAGGS